MQSPVATVRTRIDRWRVQRRRRRRRRDALRVATDVRRRVGHHEDLVQRFIVRQMDRFPDPRLDDAELAREIGALHDLLEAKGVQVGPAAFVTYLHVGAREARRGRLEQWLADAEPASSVDGWLDLVLDAPYHRPGIDDDLLVEVLGPRLGLDEREVLEQYAVRRAERRRMAYEATLRGEREVPRSVEELLTMDPLSFERFVADLYRRQGYEVRLTPVSGDQGADLVLERGGHRSVVQVKRTARAVGNGAVQEAVAAVRYHRAVDACVVAAAEFTKGARSLAAANGVRLVTGQDLLRMAGQSSS